MDTLGEWFTWFILHSKHVMHEFVFLTSDSHRLINIPMNKFTVQKSKENKTIKVYLISFWFATNSLESTYVIYVVFMDSVLIILCKSYLALCLHSQIRPENLTLKLHQSNYFVTNNGLISFESHPASLMLTILSFHMFKQKIGKMRLSFDVK